MINGIKVVVNRHMDLLEGEEAILMVSPAFFAKLRRSEQVTEEDFDLMEEYETRTAKQLACVAKLKDKEKDDG